MMRLTIIFFFLLFWSCNNEPKIPKDILPPAKMQQLLWDLMRADELLNVNPVQDTAGIKQLERTEYYYQVLQIHKVKKEVFKKSLGYYKSNPKLFQMVLDSLQSQAASEPEKLTADTLKPSAKDTLRKMLHKFKLNK